MKIVKVIAAFGKDHTSWEYSSIKNFKYRRMKKLSYLLLLISATSVLVACEKEKTSTDIIKQTNVSKLVMQKATNVFSNTSQSPFKINSAGLYQGFLYLSVSYTGGEKIHEFVVNWDGKINNEGDKKVMDLIVNHSDVNDYGTSTVYDSIAANILDLGITTEQLNNPDLWIRVTNSTNPDNIFFFKAGNEYIDPFSIIYSRNVKVVKEGCSEYGLWGDLWLISNDAKPVSHYFVTEIDKTISYTPAANDLLRIEFKYSYITDSSKVCSQLNLLKAIPIKISKLEK